MKILLLVLWIAIAAVHCDQVLQPKNSDDILDHLEGNNYNIYILFFAAASPAEELSRLTNAEIEKGINTLLTDNPELFYAKIDHTNPNFRKLVEVSGVRNAPSVFMMVHGQGVWVSEGTSALIIDRIRDFLPSFKQAASHHEKPY